MGGLREAGRILSTRELNRALLARQHLLVRSRASVPETLERIGGLQTQYAPSGYVGLWSRLEGLDRESVTGALEDRSVVQATLLRSTIHMVSARDFWPFAAGSLPARRAWWLRVQAKALDGMDPDGIVTRVRRHLAGGPRRRAEMLDLLAAEGLPRIAWVTAAQLIDMVRVPPSGTWDRRRADLYTLAEDWLPRPPVAEEEGHRHLVRSYLRGFGPARVADIASWAGVPATALRPVVSELDLRRFRDEEGRELVDLPDAPLPEPDTPAPVRFLPTWDAILLVHARRTQVLPEAHRPRVFDTKTPHSVPTFLVDGTVAGTWRYEAGRVDVEPFAPLSPAARDDVEAEAALLAGFHA